MFADQIALPDFNAGAMENWGLITYRETALLYDEEMSSNGNKERVVTVIAHELAHQVGVTFYDWKLNVKCLQMFLLWPVSTGGVVGFSPVQYGTHLLLVIISFSVSKVPKYELYHVFRTL